MRISLFIITLLLSLASQAGDLGVFNDGSGFVGSNHIHVYVTDRKLLVQGYGSTWVYTNSAPNETTFVSADGKTTAELLGEDAVLWQERADLKPRMLIKINVCN